MLPSGPTTMSLVAHAHSLRSWLTLTPSGPTRLIVASYMVLITIVPSGNHPSPDGRAVSTATSSRPASSTVITAPAGQSVNHSRSSCQRGPSPNEKPSTNNVVLTVSMPTGWHLTVTQASWTQRPREP